MNPSIVRRAAASIAAGVLSVAATWCACDSAAAQFVTYGVLRPVVAAPVVAAPTYVANYFPSGNYAAVTAFSPPVVAAPMEVGVRTAYAPVMAPPIAVASAMPTVAYYAPAMAAPVVAAPVVAMPVTTYYAPAAVAVPLYRRGLFGGLRPVRSAYMLSY